MRLHAVFIAVLLAAAPAAGFAEDVACQGATENKYTIEDLAKFVREDGAEQTYKKFLAKALGFGDGSLQTYRVGAIDRINKIYRAIDVPRGGGDYIITLTNQADDVAIVWRVAPKGRVMKAIRAEKTAVQVRPNSENLDMLQNVCDQIFELTKLPRQRSEPRRN